MNGLQKRNGTQGEIPLTAILIQGDYVMNVKTICALVIGTGLLAAAAPVQAQYYGPYASVNVNVGPYATAYYGGPYGAVAHASTHVSVAPYSSYRTGYSSYAYPAPILAQAVVARPVVVAPYVAYRPMVPRASVNINIAPIRGFYPVAPYVSVRRYR
jgi:hypothetical protein